MPAPLPADPLYRVLLNVLNPCPHLEGACKGVMRWEPDKGHAPRGFVGAIGSIDEVELVIVTAEPGEPLSGERQEIENLTPEERVRVICQFTYDQLAGTTARARDYHDNMLKILDLIWPGLSLDAKLAKAWITESVLCSAEKAGATVPPPIETACKTSYLDAQLRVLRGVPVLALGGKAQRRLGGTSFVSAYHPSAAHGRTQQERALRSWTAAAEKLRAAIQERSRRNVAETGTGDAGQIVGKSAPSDHPPAGD